MPDQYGRFNLNDGLNLAQGIMSIQGGMRQQAEFDEDRRAQALAQSLMENPETKIDSASTPAHVAFKARVLASEAQAKKAMADTAYLQNKAERYQAQMVEDMPRLQKIVTLADSGDDEGFYKAAESFYNDRVYDGAKVKFMGDGKMTVTENDGTERVVPAPSKDNILKSVTMYQDPKNYLAVNLHNDTEILKSNRDAMMNAEPLFSADGKSLGISMAYITDPVTKKQGMVYRDSYTGEPVDIDQYQKSGALPADTLKSALDIYAKRMGIASTGQELINKRLEAQNKVLEGQGKVLDIEGKGLDIEKKKKDLAGDYGIKPETAQKIADFVNGMHGKDGNLRPSQSDLAAANTMLQPYGLTYKKFDTGWSIADAKTGQMVNIISSQSPTPTRGAGLNGAGSGKAAPVKRAKSVQKRKPGESVSDYLKRTGM